MDTNNNYYEWKKGESVELSPHFNSREFSCKCTHPDCIDQKASVDLIDKLTRMREAIGHALTINSGFRCIVHQKEILEKGLPACTRLSQHELGEAADVYYHDMSLLLSEAKKEFKALGIAKNFIHMDLRNDRSRIWYYR